MDAERLTWARTGALNSRDHVAVIEPFQNRAICDVEIAGTSEVRPTLAAINICRGCARQLRLWGIEPEEIGIENDLTAERR